MLQREKIMGEGVIKIDRQFRVNVPVFASRFIFDMLAGNQSYTYVRRMISIKRYKYTNS